MKLLVYILCMSHINFAVKNFMRDKKKLEQKIGTVEAMAKIIYRKDKCVTYIYLCSCS